MPSQGLRGNRAAGLQRRRGRPIAPGGHKPQGRQWEQFSPNSEAASRGIGMLRTAMGHAIGAWLEDPAIVEIMLNPDRRLWIDRLAGGLSDTGKRLSAEDGERILRVVAHQVGAEVRSGSPQHLPVRAASCRSSVRGGVALEFELD